MRKSPIMDIFHGFRGHIETIKAPKLSRGNLDIIIDAHNELKAKLCPEIFDIYKKYDEATSVNHCEETDHYFAEGFKLGLLIGIECMED